MITYGIVSMGDFAGQYLLDSWLYGRRFHVRWVEEIRDMGYNMVILCNFVQTIPSGNLLHSY